MNKHVVRTTQVERKLAPPGRTAEPVAAST